MAFDIPDIDLTKFDSGTDKPSRADFYNMARALVNLKGAMNFAWDNASLTQAIADMATNGRRQIYILPFVYSADFVVNQSGCSLICVGRCVFTGSVSLNQVSIEFQNPSLSNSGAVYINGGYCKLIDPRVNYSGTPYVEVVGSHCSVQGITARAAELQTGKDSLVKVTGDDCSISGGSIEMIGTPSSESVIHLLGDDCNVGGGLTIKAPGAHTGIKIGDASTANKGCTVSGVNVGADTTCVGIENGDHHTVGANGLRLLTSTGVGVRLVTSTSKCTVTGNSFRGSGIYQTTQDLGTDNVVANNGIK